MASKVIDLYACMSIIMLARVNVEVLSRISRGRNISQEKLAAECRRVLDQGAMVIKKIPGQGQRRYHLISHVYSSVILIILVIFKTVNIIIISL